ncbi:MAG: gliding motility-associated C-terminal domain-containing protein [Chitinophagaceae bacterium]
MSVRVNTAITPIFAQIQPICSGTTLAPLPTTSTNGISGTWSPALNNTTTTTYTFTPSTGQGASSTTMTIFVNPANSLFCNIPSCPIGTNNGFELPVIPTWTFVYAPVPDWTNKTEPVIGLDVWPSGFTTVPNGVGVTPYEGKQFIEINANYYDTVYKTFTAMAGQQLAVGFAHRGSWGVDVMNVLISPSLSGPYTVLGTYSDDNTAWGYHTTPNYTIPSNGNYYLMFATVSAAGGNPAIGNLLDAVNPVLSTTPTFTQVAPICIGSALASLPTTSNNGITGTWSPALNNTATTTYSFTPAAGQCATTATMTIKVNQKLTPTFTQVAAICNGATIAALPTTSNNGITGTWSPALNNTATTTYTFTPSAGQCATTATMTITVNPNVTPTFTQAASICIWDVPVLPTTSNNGITGTWTFLGNSTSVDCYFAPTPGLCATGIVMTIPLNLPVTPTFTQVAAICSGAPLSSLPTTSNNGITGTWSPALNNSATTTYTFTPSPGQCARNATMTITVNPIITPTFTQVAAICNGATLAALPTTSNNGISGTWSPAINNTATTTYTFTPSIGQCATTATMTITVNSNVTPTFTQVAPICSSVTFFSLPTTSNNGITGAWSPAINNTTTTTYTFTPANGQCASLTTMTILVNPNVTPTFTQVTPICKGAALAALPTTSNNGISGTWSPAINNTATTTYTFTPSIGQCATTTTMTITVNSNVTPTFTQVAAICNGATLAALSTTSINGITGTWSPAINNTTTTTYTFTPSAGQCATTTTMTIAVNSNVTPTFTQVAAICNGATLAALSTTSINGIIGTWSPAINNTATTTYTFTPSVGQCATTTTMTITVNSGVTPTFTQVAAICSGGTLTSLPTTSNNGITGTWSPALNNTATTNYTFTPTAGQCANTASMTITVNPTITPIFNQVAAICSGGTLTSLPTTSNNGITGTWSPALNNTATTTYTFTPTANQCANTASMTITVKPLPVYNDLSINCTGATLNSVTVNATASAGVLEYSVDGGAYQTSNIFTGLSTGSHTFSIQVQGTGCVVSSGAQTISCSCPVISNNIISADQAICSGETPMTLTGSSITIAPVTVFAYQWQSSTDASNWTDITGATTKDYAPLSLIQTTYYRRLIKIAGCADVAGVNIKITVNPIVTPTFTQVSAVCSGGTLAALPTKSNNGITGSWSPVLNNTVTTTYTFIPDPNQCATTATMTIAVGSLVTPTFTQINAICSGATLAALPTTSNNGIAGTWSPAINNTTTTTYTFTPTAGQCATTATMTITVGSPVTPAFTQVSAICSGAILAALPTTSTNGIAGSWSPAINNNTTTTYTFTPNPNQCASITTMTISVNPLPVYNDLTISCTGATLNSVTVNATTNTGILEYSVDGGMYQTNNLFTGLPTGSHTFSIRIQGTSCAVSSGAQTISCSCPVISNNTISADQNICTGGTAVTITGSTVTVTPATSSTYQWQSSADGSTWNDITGEASKDYMPGALTQTTFYRRLVKLAGCPDAISNKVTIKVNPLPVYNDLTVSCAGATLNSITVNATTSLGVLEYSVDGGVYQTSNLFTGLPTGSHTFSIRVQGTSCAVSSGAQTISCSCPVISNNTISADQNICIGGTAVAITGSTATITPTTSSTYQWQSSADGSTWNDITGEVSKDYMPGALTQTTYYRRIVKLIGCPDAASNKVTIAVSSSVVPTFTQVNAICSGSALTALPTTSNNGISGTWSPALDNTATTTYTFTPDANQCATTATMTITVGSSIVPTFTQVNAICSGATLTALPTTSTNGITGTWSPAINNTATTTYTFTPDPNQCATTATMTITIGSSIVPTFTQVNAICSGATLTALPTTSTNGITGTWSPAINNTATTTYTFTPDPNQCATKATMTITIGSSIVPTFTQVNAICSGATLTALPTTSTNGITGTWSPAINNTATTTYTFTPDPNQCATTATMTITVGSSIVPTFTQVNAICSGATLTALPTTSTNGITGTWSPALDNTATTTYTFTPDPNQCATTATMTITVGSSIVPTFTQVNAICSGSALTALPTTSNNGISGTWSPALDNTATTTYTFTPDANQCATTATMTIAVGSSIVPTFTQVNAICSGATLTALSTTSINGITGTWSPALDNTATTTYTFTPDPNQCATTATMTISVNALPVYVDVTTSCTGSILNSVTVNATVSTGMLEYAVDAGNYQSSNIFNGLATGLHNFSIRTQGTTCVVSSGSQTIICSCPVISNNTIAADQNICSGETAATITGSAATAIPAATVFYQWQSSADGNNWTDIAGETLKDYSPATAITQTRYYRRMVKMTGCPDVSSNTVTINANQQQQIIISCGVNTYTSVQFNWNAIAGVTSYNYSYSINNGAAINGSSNSATVNITQLNPNDAVNITVTAVGGNCVLPATGNCSAASCPVISGNSIGTNQTICDGNGSQLLTGSTPVILPATSYFYRWQSSTDGSTWTDLPGATSKDFTPAVLHQTTSFRRLIKITGCSVDVSNEVMITVKQNIVPQFSFPLTYCQNDMAASLPTISDNGIDGTWNPAVISTITAGNTSYQFNPSSAFCAVTPAPVNVLVSSTGKPTFSLAKQYCQNAIPGLPAISDNGIKGSWKPGAINGVQGIGIYTFTPLPGECSKETAQLTIAVIGPSAFTLGRDTGVCYGEPVVLQPTTKVSGKYLWQDGSTGQSFSVQHSGNYFLTIDNGCASFTDSINVKVQDNCQLLMPTAFTPNGDGNDDIFRVKYPFPVKEFLFTVYSRWGQKIFETNNIRTGWDGTFKGQPQPAGGFAWKINAIDANGTKLSVNGVVLLLR